MRPMSLAERGIATPTTSLATLLRRRAPRRRGRQPTGPRGVCGRDRPFRLPGGPRSSPDGTPRDARRLPHGHRRARLPRARPRRTPTRDPAAPGSPPMRSHQQHSVLQRPPRRRDPSRVRQARQDDNDRLSRCPDPVVAARRGARLGGRPKSASDTGQAPKHHLADPALAARLLNASTGSLLDRVSSWPIPSTRRPVCSARCSSPS